MCNAGGTPEIVLVQSIFIFLINNYNQTNNIIFVHSNKKLIKD